MPPASPLRVETYAAWMTFLLTGYDTNRCRPAVRWARAMIRPPIFIFWDELLTFESAEAAECWLEPWCCEEPLTAYDCDGQVLKVQPGNARRGGVTITATGVVAGKDTLIDCIRSRLIGVAQMRSDLVSRAWAEQAGPEELVGWCRRHHVG